MQRVRCGRYPSRQANQVDRRPCRWSIVIYKVGGYHSPCCPRSRPYLAGTGTNPKEDRCHAGSLSIFDGKGRNKQRDQMTSSGSSAGQVLAGIRTARGREPWEPMWETGMGCEETRLRIPCRVFGPDIKRSNKKGAVQNAGIPQHEEKADEQPQGTKPPLHMKP